MRHLSIIGAVALAAGVLGTAPQATAQTVGLAADRSGTTFNTVGSGIASVASSHSDLNVIVRPFNGPAAWSPIVNDGEVALGVMSANSAYQAYSGENEADTAYENLRIVRSGDASLMLGLIVRADSDIESFDDLPGKRIASDFGGHLSIGNSMRATLAVAGLTWDDVQPVPVGGANDGIEALVADRVDASWASMGQPRAREADSQVGIRYLSAPDTPEAEAIYQEYVFPGARIVVAPDGAAPGIIGDTNLLSYDTYLVAHKDTSEEVINVLLEGLWEGTDELLPVHPSLAGFTREASVTSAPVMPYHDAAIEFYRDRDMWDDAAQASHEALLRGEFD